VIVVIGILLILTGLLQRFSGGTDFGGRRDPTVLDAVLVGAAQGIAILPGISRSGSTTGVLLLRGYQEEVSFQYSFLLSIPAAIGGGLLGVSETELASVTPLEGIVALAAAAIVGYLSISTLLRFVRQISFVGVCVGLGALAIVGGIAVIV
jgi:undecaprenyl-diphosphatase